MPGSNDAFAIERSSAADLLCATAAANTGSLNCARRIASCNEMTTGLVCAAGAACCGICATADMHSTANATSRRAIPAVRGKRVRVCFIQSPRGRLPHRPSHAVKVWLQVRIAGQSTRCTQVKRGSLKKPEAKFSLHFSSSARLPPQINNSEHCSHEGNRHNHAACLKKCPAADMLSFFTKLDEPEDCCQRTRHREIWPEVDANENSIAQNAIDMRCMNTRS